MKLTLVIHILAGSLGLLFGYVALFAAKGGALHRKSGMLFVYAMLATGLCGLVIASVRGVAPAINIPAGLLTSYLVVTALTTVRPFAAGSRWLPIVAMLVALTVGLSSLAFGFEALASGGKRNGMPAFPFFMFGVVGLLASIGDLRVMRSGALTGAARLARHLWRMSFALFIAALSFFIGQAHVLPEPLRRIPGLRALPVLAVLVTMFWWLWRVPARPTSTRSKGDEMKTTARAPGVVLRTLLICLLVPAAVAQENPDPLSANSRFLYGGMKNVLLRSVEKVPEDVYSFRPAEGVRSFGQIVGHIADSQYLFCSQALGEKNPAPKIEETRSSKADLIAALKDALAYCSRAYDGLTDASAAQMMSHGRGSMPKLGLLYLNQMHNALHYGNLVTYMRLKNIVPPTSEPGFDPRPKK